jgi:hypothetical protein
MRRLVVLALASMLLAGCAAAQAATIGGGGGVAVGGCGASAEYEYVGETSFAQLGLSDVFGGPDADRIGSVWVSSTGVVPEGGMVGSRTICIEYPDGSITAGTIDDSWQPPAVIGVPIEDTGLRVPTPILLVGGAAIVIIGFSVVAFRRDAPHSS